MQLVKKLPYKNKNNNFLYEFKCDACGGLKIMPLSNGKRDKTCGCFRSPRNSITVENIRLHQCWVNIKTRCKNTNYHKAHRYSKRNITLCKEWERFLPFQKWALENGYSNDLTIDRIDNDGSYSPDNCRWITNKENHRNSSSVKLNIFKVNCIRKRYAAGETKISLANNYCVSRRQISNIVRNIHWT